MGSVVDKATIGIRFAVDVVDCVQSALESFVDSDAIALCLVGTVVAHYCSVHLGFLVDVSQFVFS